MTALFITIAAAVVLLLIFVGALIWSIRSGQYEDLDTPAERVILEEMDERNEHGTL